MDTLRPLNPAILKRRAKALLAAAEKVLLQSAASASGFADPHDFRRSLISALEGSPPFARAAREFHAPLRAATGPWKGRGKDASQFERRAKSGGRVQAPHYDPSRGQRDRQRGRRLKGGRRPLASKRERPAS